MHALFMFSVVSYVRTPHSFPSLPSGWQHPHLSRYGRRPGNKKNGVGMSLQILQDHDAVEQTATPRVSFHDVRAGHRRRRGRPMKRHSTVTVAGWG